MPAKIQASVRERIFASAMRVGECLIWQRAPTKAGYGLIWIDGRHVQVHRAAYEAHHGPIPAGKLVMHSCDNRLCVEPAHLSVGSHADNAADMLAKKRHRTTTGAQHHHAKLTEAAAAQIRRRYKARDRINGASALAREFGVTQSTVWYVLAGRTWKKP